MSVLPSDIVIYGCADMPEADAATVGGAPDFTKGVDFTDVSPNVTLDIVSTSASDTATKITYDVRDPTGAVKSVTATFNGQTVVAGAQQAERLLYAAITGGAIGPVTNPGGTSAVGDVALFAHTLIVSAHTAQAGSANASGTTPALMKLQAGDGATVAVGQIIRTTGGTGPQQMRRIIAVSGYGTDVVAVSRNWGTIPDATTTYNVMEGMLFDISPNPILARTRLFATAAGDIPGGSTRLFYEKVFVVNNNTATSLLPQSPNTGVGIEISSESPALPSGALIDLGLATTFDDSVTIANRQTAPAGVSFTTQPNNVLVPAPGTLAPGVAPNAAGAIGAWLRLTLPAGEPTYKGSPTIQTTGTTT